MTAPTLTPTPSDRPPATRAPRLRGQRRDLRLVLGVVLVLVSVLLGARVLASAGDRTEVWVAASTLAAGSTLTSDDLVVGRVALDDVTAYAAGSDDLVGRVLRRDLAAGELVPVAALGGTATPDRRLVTVPADPLHAPPGLARGERVDVYVTPKDGASVGTVDVLPALVLSGVLVADPGAADTTGATDQIGVVLDVAAADADRAVGAARAGDVDLVRVGG